MLLKARVHYCTHHHLHHPFVRRRCCQSVVVIQISYAFFNSSTSTLAEDKTPRVSLSSPMISADCPQIKPRPSHQRSPSAPCPISALHFSLCSAPTYRAMYNDAPRLLLLDKTASIHCSTLRTSECPLSRRNWLNGPD